MHWPHIHDMPCHDNFIGLYSHGFTFQLAKHLNAPRVLHFIVLVVEGKSVISLAVEVVWVEHVLQTL